MITLLERVAREYYTKGQNTPKNGMAPGGDALYGIRNELTEKYKVTIQSLIEEELK